MFVAAFADSPKKVDALKADVELADIPVDMFRLADEWLDSRATPDMESKG